MLEELDILFLSKLSKRKPKDDYELLEESDLDGFCDEEFSDSDDDFSDDSSNCDDW